MIVAERLTKYFGRTLAVDAIDFEIGRGKVVGFLGPNGAGKTTTIRMISGFLPPTSGRVLVDGLDAQTHWREVRRRIGYLPESAPSYAEMRVEEFLAFRAKLFSMPRAARRAGIARALERCDLTHVRRRPIDQLSKGYRQRVGLAAAILHEPPVIILDEPTVGLDPSQILEFRALLRELAGRRTILLSTHILPEVEVTCDHVLMIARGRIRAAGTLSELKQRAAQDASYVLETDVAHPEPGLRTIRGVSDVDHLGVDGPWRRLRIVPAPGAGDLREAIARMVADQGGCARELKRESPSLEQLFVRITAEAEIGDPGPAGPIGEARPEPGKAGIA